MSGVPAWAGVSDALICFSSWPLASGPLTCHPSVPTGAGSPGVSGGTWWWESRLQCKSEPRNPRSGLQREPAAFLR